MNPAHPRRRVLAASLLAVLPRPAPLGATPVLATVAAAAHGLLAPIRAAAAALDGPGLLRSYVTDGDEAFDRSHAEVAYTYDNCCAALALLAGGERDFAARIAEGLRLAQDQDRHWRDSRLRNAYAAGRQFTEAPRSARPPGWWDAARSAWVEDGYAAGSATGPVAFAILLWCALGELPFLAAANRAADWVTRDLSRLRGFSGGMLGHEPAPATQEWLSTEQNLDLAVAFGRLGRTAEAARAASLVRSAWLAAEERFAAGSRPDGAVDGSSALDANIWPLLALRDPAHDAALNWVLRRHGLPAGAPEAELDGLDFNDDRDGIWLEGTAQAALLLRRLGRDALAARFLSTVLQHRQDGGWVLASDVPWLTTGLSNGDVPFRYPRRGHLAATAWGALAALDASPFDPPGRFLGAPPD